jgi:hypothetical protein
MNLPIGAFRAANAIAYATRLRLDTGRISASMPLLPAPRPCGPRVSRVPRRQLFAKHFHNQWEAKRRGLRRACNHRAMAAQSTQCIVQARGLELPLQHLAACLDEQRIVRIVFGEHVVDKACRGLQLTCTLARASSDALMPRRISSSATGAASSWPSWRSPESMRTSGAMQYRPWSDSTERAGCGGSLGRRSELQLGSRPSPG